MDTNNKKREKGLDASLTEAANGVQTAVDDFNNTNYADFKKGSDYAGLTKQYSNMGKQAMKDTMGQASARTGGYANSYAIHAGQQAQNSFMEKLEDAARGLYDSQRQEKLDKVNVANAIYDRAYGEKQDYIANQQWQDTFDYQQRQDEEQRSKAAKEDGLNNLYTDLSLLSDDDLKGATWDNYQEAFKDAGLTEEDFNRYKGIVQNDRNVAASEQQAATAESAKEDLLTELMNGGTFDPFDPRIKDSGKDPSYFYNQWKAGWKDTALSQEATDDAIISGNLTPNVLKSYEVHYGNSYCQKCLDGLVENGSANAGIENSDKYVEAWYNYDPTGCFEYIDNLPHGNPVKEKYGGLFTGGGAPSSQLPIYGRQKLAMGTLLPNDDFPLH